MSSRRNVPIVFFDLETTGLVGEDDDIPEIINLGAVDCYDKNITYDEIYHPNEDITSGASRVNGFTKRYYTRSGFIGTEYLCLHGRIVRGMEMKKGLESFLDWLDNEYNEPVLLVSHNCFKFDAKVYSCIHDCDFP